MNYNYNNKPLILIPSPRDIEAFEEATDKLNFDKLWMKYYPQEEAYTTARDWFLYHDEYKYLVILPDDLIVVEPSIHQLLGYAGSFGDVISGWCGNTVLDDGTTDSNISIYNIPPDPPLRNLYKELHFEPISLLEEMIRRKFSLIPVKHQGFAITVLPRPVVEEVPFRTSAGCCVDSCLSIDLHKKQIPQYVDLRVRGYHIPTKPDILKVGKKEKEIIFELAV